MKVSNPETLDKVVDFLEMSQHPNFSISPTLFRSFTGCMAAACGGCCKKLSLNYLDGSDRWERFKDRYPEQAKDFTLREFKGVKFWSNMQEDNPDYYCKYLNKVNGLCTIHENSSHPLSCDLPFWKFSPRTSPKGDKKTMLASLPYGRPWTFRKVSDDPNGKPSGAGCYSTPFEWNQTASHLDKLRELKEHGDAFGMDMTQLQKAIDVIQDILNNTKGQNNPDLPKEQIKIGSGT